MMTFKKKGEIFYSLVILKPTGGVILTIRGTILLTSKKNGCPMKKGILKM